MSFIDYDSFFNVGTWEVQALGKGRGLRGGLECLGEDLILSIYHHTFIFKLWRCSSFLLVAIQILLDV